MKMKRSKKTLSLILCMVLLVAMAQFTIGCNDKTNTENPESVASNIQEVENQQDKGTQQDQDTQQDGETQQEEVQQETDENKVQVVGEGSTVFLFNVVDRDGNVTNFEVHTDKTKVGEALLELGLIEGENGDYGLYVKKVNGIAADYNTDGVYWAFYVNGEYGQTGVDLTDIKEGDTYTFKVE